MVRAFAEANMKFVAILVVGMLIGVGGTIGVLWKLPQARAFASAPHPSNPPHPTLSTLDELNEPTAPERFFWLVSSANGTVNRCQVPDKFASEFERGQAYRSARLADMKR